MQARSDCCFLGLAEYVARIWSAANCQQVPCKDNRFCLFVTNKQTNKRTPRQLEESDDELLSYASQTLSKRNPQTSGFLEQGKAVGVLSGESREIIKFRQQLLTLWVMRLIDITYAMITFRTLATA